LNTDDPEERRRVRQRHTAVAILRGIIGEVERGMPADAALARIYKEHSEFGSRDRRHYTHVVFSYFRWRGLTSIIAPENLELQCAWSVALDPTSDEFVRLLWIPLTGLNDAEQIELAGLSIEAKIERLNQSKHFTLSLNLVMPDWLAGEITVPDGFNALIHSCSTRPPAWVRIKPEQVRSFTEMLTAQQIQFSVHPTIASAIALESSFNLQQLERAWGGAIQVQDIASQIVGLICAANYGETWWDTCSGAGGKTMILAEHVGETGSVLATDVRETILENLQRRATEHRLANIKTRLLDAAQHAPGGVLFDGILVDAPCSGIGTWPRNPDARWRLPQSDIAARAATQLSILNHTAACVRPGGKLVYSVCTLTDAETHHVIETFLKNHPDFARMNFVHPATGEMINGELTILPSDGPGDGMFVAMMERCCQ